MGQGVSTFEGATALSLTSSPEDYKVKSNIADAFNATNQYNNTETSETPVPNQETAKPSESSTGVASHEVLDDKKQQEQQQQKQTEIWNVCITEDGIDYCSTSSVSCDLPKLLNLSTDSLSFIVNPSIAELSHLTALRMMQNFEEFAKINDLLNNEANETQEILHEENPANEKDFRTISYESLPTIQSVDNAETLKRDSSTHTADIEELVLLENYESIDSKVEELSSQEQQQQQQEEEEQSSEEKENPEAVTATSEVVGSTEHEVNVDEDETTSNSTSSTLKNEVEEVESVQNEKSKDEEMLQLREKLDKLESERNEAVSRLKLAEEKYMKLYEIENRSFEAVLGSMETKLRDIVMEFSVEVKKSKDLEQQLSRVFRNSTGTALNSASNP